MLSLIKVRDYEPADENLLYSTFLSGLYFGDSWFSKIKKHVFFSNYRSVINTILLRPTTKVKIACLIEDPSVIIGYSILVNNEQALAWVFVKKDFRKTGIARILVPSTVIEVTNLTKVGENLLKKYPHVSFNPFQI